MTRWKIGVLADVEPGELRRFEAGGVAICVGHVEGQGLFAINDICTHEAFDLSDGDLDGVEVECPAHGSRFNIMTGEVRGLPATVPAQVFPLEVVGEDIYVDL